MMFDSRFGSSRYRRSRDTGYRQYGNGFIGIRYASNKHRYRAAWGAWLCFACKSSGLRLNRLSGRDLMAEHVVKFATVVELSAKAVHVAELLGMTPSRVRQLIATRELNSFSLDRKRMIPLFQIRNQKLVPNIVDVNRELPDAMHSVAIYNWYHLENEELFTDYE